MIRIAAALVLSFLAPPALAHGWGSLEGDGHKVTQPRTVGTFDAVRLEGSLDVEVKVGAPAAVAVTIDSNLQPEVEVRVEGRTLVVSTRHGISYRGAGKVEGGMPALTALAIDGSGDVEVTLVGGSLDAEVSGSGDVHWSGDARVERVAVSGSGEISRR